MNYYDEKEGYYQQPPVKWKKPPFNADRREFLQNLTNELLEGIKQHQLPLPQRNYCFSGDTYHVPFAWPSQKLLVVLDQFYYPLINLAVSQGWHVFCFKAYMVQHGTAIGWLKDFFAHRNQK